MNRKKSYIKTLKLGLILLVSLYLSKSGYRFLRQIELDSSKINTTISIEGKFQGKQSLQVYYSEGAGFNVDNFITETTAASNEVQRIDFILPELKRIRDLRLDFGTSPNIVELKNITFSQGNQHYKVLVKDIALNIRQTNQIKLLYPEKDVMKIVSNGTDPFITFKFDYIEVLEKIRPWNYWIVPAFYSGIISLLVFFWLIQLKISIPQFKRTDRLRPGIKFNPKLIVVISFFLIIAIPAGTMLINDSNHESNHENRTKTALPVLNIHALLEYPKKYSNYFNDHFGLRNTILKWHSYIKFFALNTSPVPEKVFLGKQGWLYFSENYDPRYHNLSFNYSEKVLEKIKNSLEERANYLKNQGAKSYIIIPPIKHRIYPEYLPDHLKNQKVTKLDQLIAYLKNHSFIKIIDIRSELLEQKKKEQIYFKSDIHWNVNGAFVGYKKLMNTIAKDFPSIKPIPDDSITFKILKKHEGDLGRMILLNELWDEKEVGCGVIGGLFAQEVKPSPYQNLPLTRSPTVVFKLEDQSKPKLVMYKDSYGVYLTPLLNEHFSRSVYVWSHYLTPQLIEQEKPDIVIFELLESLMYQLEMENDSGISSK